MSCLVRTSRPNGSSKVRLWPWPAPSHGVHGAWDRAKCLPPEIGRRGCPTSGLPCLPPSDGSGARSINPRPAFSSLAPFGPSSRRSRARSRAPFCGPWPWSGCCGVGFPRPRGEACWRAPWGSPWPWQEEWPCGFGRCPSPLMSRNFPRSPRRAMPTSTILSGWCPKVVIASTSTCAPWNGKKRGLKSAISPSSNPTRPASRSAIGCLDTSPPWGGPRMASTSCNSTPKMFGPLNRAPPTRFL